MPLLTMPLFNRLLPLLLLLLLPLLLLLLLLLHRTVARSPHTSWAAAAGSAQPVQVLTY
jgi:hypothetical protein